MINLLHDLDEDQLAFRRLKDAIKQSYPTGQHVAIAGGQIVADAPAFHDLRTRLQALGHNPTETLIVQAGADYPEFAYILVG